MSSSPDQECDPEGGSALTLPLFSHPLFWTTGQEDRVNGQAITKENRADSDSLCDPDLPLAEQLLRGQVREGAEGAVSVLFGHVRQAREGGQVC